MKEKISRYNLISTIIITIMAFIMFVTTTFAWFSVKDNSNLSFTAGNCDITLYSSSYIFNEETQTGYYQFNEETALEFDKVTQDPNLYFGDLYETPTFVTHLGTIDNLAFRKEENNLWYCLKINKSTGSKFSLRLSLNDTSPYKMFSDLENTNGQVNAGDSTEANAAITRINELIEGLICVDSLIVTTISYENFFENVIIPDADESVGDKLNVLKYSSSGAQSFTGNVNNLDLSSTNYFYLYFRAYPNLDTYVDLVDYISVFMPCVLQFGLKLSLAVDYN